MHKKAEIKKKKKKRKGKKKKKKKKTGKSQGSFSDTQPNWRRRRSRRRTAATTTAADGRKQRDPQFMKQPTDDHAFLLNTGALIPAVGLGTWQAQGEDCRDAVRAALNAGYRHFDCAHLYGNESEVGHALAEALDPATPAGPGADASSNNDVVSLTRDQIFVTSKVILVSTAVGASRRVRKAADASLRSLRLDYLDLFLLHWIPPSSARHIGDSTDPPRAGSQAEAYHVAQLHDTWHAMEELVRDGLVRAIGVSDFDVPLLAELLSVARIVPAVNQVELHPLWRQDKLVKYCQERGIHVSAHTPLGLPGTTYEGQQEVLLSPRFSRSFSVHHPLLRNSVIGQLVEKLHKTPAQILLRWAIQRGTSVLPRSLNPDRIRSNLDILNWSLSPHDWELVNSMEPQFSLAVNDIDDAFHNADPNDSPTTLPSNFPLQSVDELLDFDDNIGNENTSIL